MKNTIKQFLTVTIITAIAILIVSCGASKKIANADRNTPAPTDEVLITTYCTESEYQSDATSFRFSAVSTSMNQMVSKNQALSQARAGLAAQVNTLINRVTDNYNKSLNIQNSEELSILDQGRTLEIVNQSLSGTRTICEKVTLTKDGSYKTYVCIELGGPELLTSLNNKFSQEAALKVDYDYEKFKKTFEAEMAAAAAAAK